MLFVCLFFKNRIVPELLPSAVRNCAVCRFILQPFSSFSFIMVDIDFILYCVAD